MSQPPPANRPRNRNRPPRQQQNGNGTGGFREYKSVPTIAQVVPGAAVSIVLKADQPTGREVQGTVQELLTRGDHPRGIKVRLVDGRIGRVQRMGSQDSTATRQSLETIPLDALNNTSPSNTVSEGPRARPQRHRMVSDIRTEDPYLYTDDRQHASRNLGEDLVEAALLRQKKPKKGRAVIQKEPTPETEPPSRAQITCPICNDFDGDEAAVTHHVNTHLT